MLSCEIPPFPTRLRESPTHVGHTLVSSRGFLLHSDSRGSFRISGWSASSSLWFTWWLVDAVRSFSPSPVAVCYVFPKNLSPPFLLLHSRGIKCDNMTLLFYVYCSREPTVWLSLHKGITWLRSILQSWKEITNLCFGTRKGITNYFVK